MSNSGRSRHAACSTRATRFTSTTALHHGVRRAIHVVMPLRHRRQRPLRARQSWLGCRSAVGCGEVPSITHAVGEVTREWRSRWCRAARFRTLGTGDGRQVWQNLTIERYRRAMPIAIQPFVIQQEQRARRRARARMGSARFRNRKALWIRLPVVRPRCNDRRLLCRHPCPTRRAETPQRLTLWLILAVCAAPLAAAYLAYLLLAAGGSMRTTASCHRAAPGDGHDFSRSTEAIPVRGTKGDWVLVSADAAVATSVPAQARSHAPVAARAGQRDGAYRACRG